MERDRTAGAGWARAVPPAVIGAAAALFFREALVADRLFFFRDVTTFIYPTRRLVTDLIRGGQWPLWNPYLQAGVPLLANVESNVLYPLNALHYLLPFDLGFKLFILLHYPLAGLGLYALAREWGLGRGAATLGAVAYMLSGPVVSLASVVNHLPSMAWLPLTVLGLERARRRGPWPAAGWTAGALALQSLGDPQIVYLTVVLLVAYAAVGPVGPGLPTRARALLLVGAIGLLAALLAAVQLVPLAELYRESIRAAGLSLADRVPSSLRPVRWVEVVLPRLFGDPTGGTYWLGLARGEPTPWLLSPYLGLAPLVLAALAVTVARAEPVVRALALAALLGGGLALGDATPLYRVASAVLPFFGSFRYPDKWWLVTTFAVAGLAAFGVEARRRRPSGGAGPRGVALGSLAASAAILALTLAVRRRPELLTALSPLFRVEGEPGRTLVAFAVRRASAQGLLAASLLAGTGLVLLFPATAGIRRRLVEGALLALLLGDVLLNQARLAPVAPTALQRTPSPVASLLAGEPPPFRILTVGEDFAYPPVELVPLLPRDWRYYEWLAQGLYPNTAFPHRLAEQQGTTSARLRRTEEVRHAFERAGRWSAYLALWNVRYVIGLRDLAGPDLEEFRRVPVTAGPAVRVYRHPGTLPRVWVVGRARAFDRGEALLRYLASPAFDPRTEVLVEGPGGEVAPGRWQAVVVGASVNELQIDVGTEGGGWLVVAEAWYPGWRAWIDGQPAALQPGNHAQRAVRVGPGLHRVRLAYRPASVALGAAVTALALAGLGLAAVLRRPGPGRGAPAQAPAAPNVKPAGGPSDAGGSAPGAGPAPPGLRSGRV